MKAKIKKFYSKASQTKLGHQYFDFLLTNLQNKMYMNLLLSAFVLSVGVAA